MKLITYFKHHFLNDLMIMVVLAGLIYAPVRYMATHPDDGQEVQLSAEP